MFPPYSTTKYENVSTLLDHQVWTCTCLTPSPNMDMSNPYMSTKYGVKKCIWYEHGNYTCQHIAVFYNVS